MGTAAAAGATCLRADLSRRRQRPRIGAHRGGTPPRPRAPPTLQQGAGNFAQRPASLRWCLRAGQPLPLSSTMGGQMATRRRQCCPGARARSSSALPLCARPSGSGCSSTSGARPRLRLSCSCPCASSLMQRPLACPGAQGPPPTPSRASPLPSPPSRRTPASTRPCPCCSMRRSQGEGAAAAGRRLLLLMVLRPTTESEEGAPGRRRP